MPLEKEACSENSHFVRLSVVLSLVKGAYPKNSHAVFGVFKCCHLKRGLTPKIRRLCFVILNKRSFNFYVFGFWIPWILTGGSFNLPRVPRVFIRGSFSVPGIPRVFMTGSFNLPRLSSEVASVYPLFSSEVASIYLSLHQR